MLTNILSIVVCIILSTAWASGQSFFDVDTELLEGRVRYRNLLQVDEEIEEREKEKEEEKKEPPKEDIKLENMAGPTKFFLGENKRLPKLLMEIKDGIHIILKEDKEKYIYVLNEPALGGISGSRINNSGIDGFEDLKVIIDYKGQKFSSQGENGPTISLGIIGMMFELVKGTYTMTELEVSQLGHRGQFLSFEFLTKTNYGYKVSAPSGLAWGCKEPGLFHCMDQNKTTTASLRLPELHLQAFKVNHDHRGPKFGPLWECGDLIPIGLWVGILVTLGFASICVWGFTMLANINTMDRFDDPRGKTINVPQTED